MNNKDQVAAATAAFIAMDQRCKDEFLVMMTAAAKKFPMNNKKILKLVTIGFKK